MGKIIVIQGYLASGKSTFARRLSKAVGIPYLIKDTFKESLCIGAPVLSREESGALSAMTFSAILYVSERLLETGTPFIIEGNFVPAGVKKADECGLIRALIERYGCEALTYKFCGNTRVLYERFIAREHSAQRERASKMAVEPSYRDFAGWCKNLDGFDVGGRAVTVDTTCFEAVDFEKKVETARVFLSGARAPSAAE